MKKMSKGLLCETLLSSEIGFLESLELIFRLKIIDTTCMSHIHAPGHTELLLSEMSKA